MNTTTTIYNGSLICECGKPITPFESLWGKTCQPCRAKWVTALVKNKMVAP